MVNIDKDKFFRAYRDAFGPINQMTVDALLGVIAFLSADPRLTVDPPLERQATAYVLATAKWESGHTFLPVTEYGTLKYFEGRYGCHTEVGKRLGNKFPGDGAKFCGRGFVQLTGWANYNFAGNAIGIDLLLEPDRACEPSKAWAILSRGMTDGWFTGKRLADYKLKAGFDFVKARRIINGLDKAAAIADIARKLDAILFKCAK